MTSFGSVCSGIEAATLAFSPLGWRAVWLAEIDRFACGVLAHHYPDTPNLGDMTKIARTVLLREVEAPDVLCGGTPCQAFSVAGLRNSLADERGNLTLKFVELADAIDHVRGLGGNPPSVIVWENVPGVLSTKDNAFGCFLAGLAGEDEPLQPSGGRWSNAGCVYGPQRAVAWRTLDAQYFGLAQRRRRVFVVASARQGFDPAQVLFEWDGVRRDSAPSREAGEAVAPCVTSGSANGGAAHGARSGSAKEGLIVPIVAPTIPSRSTAGGGLGTDFDCGGLIARTLRGEGFDASEDGAGRGTPLVPMHCRAVAQTITSNYGKQVDSSDTALGPNVVAGTFCMATGQGGAEIGAEISPTLNFNHEAPIAFDTTQITSDANYSHPKPGDPCHPLATGDHAPAISFALRGREGGAAIETGEDLAFTLRASSGGGDKPHVFATHVRRLTPWECESLQGFPQGFTAIPWRGKPASDCPDGPRYKALGNSWAVPCAAWIGRRINAVITHLESRS